MVNRQAEGKFEHTDVFFFNDRILVVVVVVRRLLVQEVADGLLFCDIVVQIAKTAQK
jgi:hypothetical protein